MESKMPKLVKTFSQICTLKTEKALKNENRKLSRY